MREMGERERGRRNRAREKESDREMRDIGGGGGRGGQRVRDTATEKERVAERNDNGNIRSGLSTFSDKTLSRIGSTNSCQKVEMCGNPQGEISEKKQEGVHWRYF